MEEKRAWADSTLMQLINSEGGSLAEEEMLADSAFQIYQLIGDTCKQAMSRILQASRLEMMGNVDSALVFLYWADQNLNSGCDSSYTVHLWTNMASLFLTLEDYDRIDSLDVILSKYWNSKWSDDSPRFGFLNNLGISQAYRGMIDESTTTFRKALVQAEEANNLKFIKSFLNNLGTIKGMMGEMDSVAFYLNRSAEISLQERDMETYIPLLMNLANIESDRGNISKSLTLLDSAAQCCREIDNLELLAEIYQRKSTYYYYLGEFEKAYHHLDTFTYLRDSFLNEEMIKTSAEMMERYESEKKTRQIKELEIEKLDAQLETERISSIRNIILTIGIAILVIAILLYSRLRIISRARKEIRKQKNAVEALLLNILPASVAGELQEKGYANTRKYDHATILFSDFKEFTRIAEKMNPTDLVEEINVCFKAFDEITTKYGIEKIKTIGDAYMAAGGLPDPEQSSIQDVVNAALDMMQFIQERRQEKSIDRKPAFDMRIGIHTGPVVAGVVGTKKFQYDIWGDTVNLASRLESASEPGKVNISKQVWEKIKSNSALTFTKRGKITVKGKGEIDMYFVEREG